MSAAVMSDSYISLFNFRTFNNFPTIKHWNKKVSHHVLVDSHTHHHVFVSTIDLQLLMTLWREQQVEILSESNMLKKTSF